MNGCLDCPIGCEGFVGWRRDGTLWARIRPTWHALALSRARCKTGREVGARKNNAPLPEGQRTNDESSKRHLPGLVTNSLTFHNQGTVYKSAFYQNALKRTIKVCVSCC